jgi:hypothetical protein
VNESRGPFSALRVHGDVYYAFWSDTQLGFRGVPLFGVHPADRIAVSLRRRNDGWQLAIVDASTLTQRRFFTPDESAGVFNLAEFLQEDPARLPDVDAVPYPKLAGMRFAQMRVDS